MDYWETYDAVDEYNDNAYWLMGGGLDGGIQVVPFVTRVGFPSRFAVYQIPDVVDESSTEYLWRWRYENRKQLGGANR